MNTCMMCANAGLFSQDVTKRICRGGPPQIVVAPTPQGVQLQNMFPLVNANDQACGAFELKGVIQMLDKKEMN
jgi:hypothetical protein